MTNWTFAGSVEYLENLPRETLIPARVVGVSRIAFLLERLGNPQSGLRVAHVAGSSGKGSTSGLIAAALRESEYAVGLFRSPHLISYRERIAVNGVDVDERVWVEAFQHVWPVAETMSANGYPGCSWGRPSHGEILLAMALLAFRFAGVQWAVIETGMGGRLDATNVLESDIAIITNISLEHTNVLGSTIREIAVEKAAIIKPGSVAVTGADDSDALTAIYERAHAVGARIVEARHAVRVTARDQSIHGQRVRVTGQSWRIDTLVPLAGSYQLANIAVAVAALEELQVSAPRLSASAVQKALATVSIPGRLEVVGARPLILLDGAHSTAGAQALGQAIDELLPHVPITLLFGAMSDKDLDAMARALGPRARSLVVTRTPGSVRAATSDRLREVFHAYGDAKPIDDVDEALTFAFAHTLPTEAIIVAGSLYLVGWVRAVLLQTEVIR